jgi:hypothetical protein
MNEPTYPDPRKFFEAADIIKSSVGNKFPSIPTNSKTLTENKFF